MAKIIMLTGDVKTVADSIAFVGDGINDAPILSRADIVINMGILALIQQLIWRK